MEERELPDNAYLLRASCKHTGFSEFDNLSGYVVDSYKVDWRGADGTRWRKVVTVINLGRPDRGAPVDPDAQIVDEPWEKEQGRTGINKAVAANEVAGEARRQLRRARIAEFLAEFGVSTCAEIADSLGYVKVTTKDVLVRYEGAVFCRVGTVRGPGNNAVIWGLVGVHDKEAA